MGNQANVIEHEYLCRACERAFLHYEAHCVHCSSPDVFRIDDEGSRAMQAAFDDVAGATEARQWGHAQR